MTAEAVLLYDTGYLEQIKNTKEETMHILSIKPEVILYVYMASCVAVLVFNVLYIFIDKYRGRRLEHQSLEMVDEITGQIQQMEAGVDVREEYFTGLIRRLKKLEKLRAFELSMEEIRRQMPAGRTEKYLEQMRRVFLEISPCI